MVAPNAGSGKWRAVPAWLRQVVVLAPGRPCRRHVRDWEPDRRRLTCDVFTSVILGALLFFLAMAVYAARGFQP
jgi:hypothetical protein